MRAPKRERVEVPGLKPVAAFETGVFLGVNAIENSVLLMNSPRCPFVRGLKVFVHNDLAGTVYRATGRHRVITTEWTGYEDVGGGETAFLRRLREAAGRHPGHWLFAFQNISSLVSGFDLRGALRAGGGAARVVPVPIDGPRLDEDWLGGYDAVLAGVLGRVVSRRGRPVELLLAGNLFCRNEGDERANVAELRRLLGALGVRRPSILLAGGRLALEPLRPRATIALPYAGGRAEAALRRAGVVPARVGLPVGIEGTAEWLRAVGRALGREPAAEACLERELRKLVPEIQWITAEHLLGRRAAVVADAHLGGALARFLDELGLSVRGWFVTGGGRAPAGGRRGARRAESAERTFVEPTVEQFASFLEDDPVDLVIGGSSFKYLALDRGVPYVELGFPSYLTHVLHPRPYLGFAGARCIVESLLNALLERDQRRHATEP